MEKITIKSMIKDMDRTYEETMSRTLIGVVKLVNKMVQFNDRYAALYTERRAA